MSNEGCGRKIGDFRCCSVVQGDCLELMKGLPADSVDLLLADPMYGNSANIKGYSSRRGFREFKGCRLEGKDWPETAADNKPFDPTRFINFPEVILWGANYFASRLQDSQSWIIWDKRAGGSSDDNADCEMAWSNIGGPARLYTHLWRGWMRAGKENIAVSGAKLHPFQKPEALIGFCLMLSKTSGTVLDPFLGSGTTAVAALKLGRHFLGFEISEEYCKIARARIALVENQPTLFEKVQRTEQMRLDAMNYDGPDKIGALMGEVDAMIELEMLKGK